jgi:hypothetical protein
VRTDSHLSVVKAQVREGHLSRHAAVRFEIGRVFAVVTGLGLPRTWQYAMNALIEGFERGLEETKGQERLGSERLLVVADRARSQLAEACDHLVERNLPDVAFAALSVDRGELHVVSAGAVRVYLQRAGKPQRLTPRDEAPGGILRSRVAHCGAPLEPGDLVLAGSATAFSVRAIAQVVTVLQQDPRTSPAVIASLLTDPAGQAGAGAAAAVIRVV